jgi:hypothetical protein
MGERLSFKLMLPAAIVVILGISAFGFAITHYWESTVRSHADQEASGQLGSVLNTLQTVNDLSSQTVHAAMKVLLEEGEQLGAPNTKGSTRIEGKEVPDLYLGRSAQVGQYALVDHIKSLTGCTSTLFVKDGDQFVRVSSNVLKADGSRAVKTTLDPQGRAFASIREGESFYGVVDILGTPYMAGYEPMRNLAKEVVGIWYVGLPLTTLADLGKRGARSIWIHCPADFDAVKENDGGSGRSGRWRPVPAHRGELGGRDRRDGKGSQPGNRRHFQDD